MDVQPAAKFYKVALVEQSSITSHAMQLRGDGYLGIICVAISATAAVVALT